MHNKTKTNTEPQQTMGSTLEIDQQQQNTALEQTAAEVTGGLNTFYHRQSFTLVSVVVKSTL